MPDGENEIIDNPGNGMKIQFWSGELQPRSVIDSISGSEKAFYCVKITNERQESFTVDCEGIVPEDPQILTFEVKESGTKASTWKHRYQVGSATRAFIETIQDDPARIVKLSDKRAYEYVSLKADYWWKDTNKSWGEESFKLNIKRGQ
jgi:hypothetical protein